MHAGDLDRKLFDAGRAFVFAIFNAAEPSLWLLETPLSSPTVWENWRSSLDDAYYADFRKFVKGLDEGFAHLQRD